ncbi:MAG: hypothetical protein ACPG4K_04805 [Haloferula sp.]
MNEVPPPQTYSPFEHLHPELWTRSKVSHITLFSIGTLLMIPGLYGLFAFAMLVTMWGMFASSLDAEEMLGIGSALASVCFGGIAWSGLGLLFFKRADVRWQRICWIMVVIFGFVCAPSAVGWWISAAQELPSVEDEPGVLWAHAIFLFITATSVGSITFGLQNSARAKRVRNAAGQMSHPLGPEPGSADAAGDPPPPAD